MTATRIVRLCGVVSAWCYLVGIFGTALLLLLFLLASVANAQGTVPSVPPSSMAATYQYCFNQAQIADGQCNFAPRFGSAQAACSSQGLTADAEQLGAAPTYAWFAQCRNPANTAQIFGNATRDYTCPAGYARDGNPSSGGTYMCTPTTASNVCPANSGNLSGGSCTCNSGYSAQGGSCVAANACTAGASIDLEFFSSFKDAQTGNLISVVDLPTTASYGGCAYARDAGTGLKDCYSYSGNTSKVFCSVTMTNTGSASTTPTSNNAPPETCPSTYAYGTVNGRAGCYPGSQTVVSGAPPTAGGASAPAATSGTGGATDNAGTGGGANGGGTGGTGGGAAGGAGTGAGKGAGGAAAGSGNDPVPMCGRPETPPCKIDETGTPTPTATDFAAATTKLDTEAQKVIDGINAAGGSGKKTDLGFAWVPSLPSASCTSWTWNVKGSSHTIDWCPWFDKAQAMFGWFIGTLAALYAWKRGTSAVGSGGK